MKNELAFDKEKLLKTYNPDFAMAYGSGVFKQEGYSEEEKPMLDFIFGVKDTRDWHRINLMRNPQDYSFLVREFGVNLAEKLQNSGAKIYYNTYCDFDGQMIKYGIISTEDIISDLTGWKDLYVAGRLQKPVEILKNTEDIEIAREINLNYALNAALLMLPETFSEVDLCVALAGISYIGDSRMKYGENPKKVTNIVTKNMEGFRNLYANTLSKKSNIITTLNEGIFEQSKSEAELKTLFVNLPKSLSHRVEFNSHPIELAERIRLGIAEIVNGPTKTQTLKGLVTAGPIKSFKYVSEKMKKAKK